MDCRAAPLAGSAGRHSTRRLQRRVRGELAAQFPLMPPGGSPPVRQVQVRWPTFRRGHSPPQAEARTPSGTALRPQRAFVCRRPRPPLHCTTSVPRSHRRENRGVRHAPLIKLEQLVQAIVVRRCAATSERPPAWTLRVDREKALSQRSSPRRVARPVLDP